MTFRSPHPRDAAQATVDHPRPARLRAARSAAAFLVAMTCLLFASGCTTGQKDASSYEDTRDAFLDGCTSIATSDNQAIEDDASTGAGKTRISSPTDYCGCVFDEIRSTFPFAEFKRINAKLRDEGGALPQAFQDAYASCDAGSASPKGDP